MNDNLILGAVIGAMIVYLVLKRKANAIDLPGTGLVLAPSLVAPSAASHACGCDAMAGLCSAQARY